MEPVCRFLRWISRPPKAVWKHLGFSGIVDFTVCGKTVRMRHTGVQLENSLFWAGYGGDYEGTTLLIWEQLCRQSDVIFDVGANTGLFALAAKAAAPSAKVHAFEPLPEIADILDQNVKINDADIAVHRTAVSDRSGVAVIRTSLGGHDYSASLSHMDWMDYGASKEIEVPLVMLSDIIKSTDKMNVLIKLDVERHEANALRGLWNNEDHYFEPTFIIELLDGQVAMDVARLFKGRGYISFSIRDGIEVRMEPIWATPISGNWLMVPPRSTGWAQSLIESGGRTHGELAANRPTNETRT